MEIRVNEIFCSIDGEVNIHHQGCITTFIRFQGCPLDCSWCDTEKARDPEGGTLASVEGVVRQVNTIGCPKVTITGGEPLMQREAFTELISMLRPFKIKITVETSGFTEIGDLHDIADGWVVDYKLPSSGEHNKMIPTNYTILSERDFIKFPIATMEDYEMAKLVISHLRGITEVKFAFSPVWGECSPNELLGRMIEDRFFIPILNVQLHKLINVD